MTDLFIVSVLLLHHGPRLSVVAICNFKLGDKLHHSKILRPLSDDACDAFCPLQINLTFEREKNTVSFCRIGL